MQEVWVRFDEDWAEKFTACAGSETRLRGSTSAQGTVQKRQREDGDNSSSDDHGRAPKRSIPQQTFSLPFAMYCISLSDLNSNQKLTRKDYEAIRDENADPPDILERSS
jgi:hypothetical protein